MSIPDDMPLCPFCRREGNVSALGWATCSDCALECTVTKWREFAEYRAKAEAFDAFLGRVRARNEAGMYLAAEPTDLLDCLAEARRKAGLA